MGLMMGFVNVIGRSFGVLSPLIAEMDPPTPMVSIIILSLLASIASFFLVVPDKENIRQDADSYAEQ